MENQEPESTYFVRNIRDEPLRHLVSADSVAQWSTSMLYITKTDVFGVTGFVEIEILVQYEANTMKLVLETDSSCGVCVGLSHDTMQEFIASECKNTVLFSGGLSEHGQFSKSMSNNTY